MNTPEDFLKSINIKDRTIRVLTFNDKNYMLTDLMLDYAKIYSECLVKKVDIADVGGNEVALKLKQFAEQQQYIPDDIQAVINDKFWDLL